ncbi:MAG TPA: hypothetical protein VII84_05235 [Acidimicrobiales bacterium]
MRLALTLVAIFVVVAVVAVWFPTKVLRRRQVKTPGSSDVVVRCAKGHLFTTIWIPGASFKSVRLGFKRYQHCPVGHHWSVVTPVSATELSEAERTEAARVHDIRIP